MRWSRSPRDSNRASRSHVAAANRCEASGDGRPESRYGERPEAQTGARHSSTARPSGSCDRRGQTTLDFTVGTTLFLIVLATVFLFLPGALQPFTEGGQEKIVTVNRVADSLVEGALVDPTTPHVLDTTCTVAFFEGAAPPTDCRYSGSNVNEQVGVRDERSVNVTVRGTASDGDGQSGELLCWDDEAAELKEQSDCGASDELLAIGAAGSGTTKSSVTARRVGEFNQRDVHLVVELW